MIRKIFVFHAFEARPQIRSLEVNKSPVKLNFLVAYWGETRGSNRVVALFLPR